MRAGIFSVDTSTSDSDLERLSDRVRFVLQCGRMVALDEERLELAQEAYDAL